VYEDQNLFELHLPRLSLASGSSLSPIPDFQTGDQKQVNDLKVVIARKKHDCSSAAGMSQEIRMRNLKSAIASNVYQEWAKRLGTVQALDLVDRHAQIIIPPHQESDARSNEVDPFTGRRFVKHNNEFVKQLGAADAGIERSPFKSLASGAIVLNNASMSPSRSKSPSRLRRYFSLAAPAGGELPAAVVQPDLRFGISRQSGGRLSRVNSATLMSPNVGGFRKFPWRRTLRLTWSTSWSTIEACLISSSTSTKPNPTCRNT
jgi:hypothetical protein